MEEMMSVGKSVYLAIGVLVSALFLFGCEGDQGLEGPQGFEGPIGPPGNNFTPPPIATQNFGLMLNNSTANDYSGAPKIEITSDANAVPSANRVVARLMDVAPMIDGIDGGTQEWGDALTSTIALSNLAGADNGIATVKVRFGYDRTYVYAQFIWTEVATGDFTVGADTTKDFWNLSEGSWIRSGGEDKLFLAWEISDVVGWDTEGLNSIFDGTSFKTSNIGELADLWVWQSTESYYADIVSDNVVTFAIDNGLTNDLGTTAVLPNAPLNGLPRYMKSNSPRVGTNYPLQIFEYSEFIANYKWAEGAKIPGYVTKVPAGSAADIQSVGTFFSDTWIVELRRLRNTGHADDLGF